jgi:hypothetical protein
MKINYTIKELENNIVHTGKICITIFKKLI